MCCRRCPHSDGNNVSRRRTMSLSYVGVAAAESTSIRDRLNPPAVSSLPFSAPRFALTAAAAAVVVAAFAAAVAPACAALTRSVVAHALILRARSVAPALAPMGAPPISLLSATKTGSNTRIQRRNPPLAQRCSPDMPTLLRQPSVLCYECAAASTTFLVRTDKYASSICTVHAPRMARMQHRRLFGWGGYCDPLWQFSPASVNSCPSSPTFCTATVLLAPRYAAQKSGSDAVAQCRHSLCKGCT